MTTMLDVGAGTAAIAARVCDAIDTRTPLRVVGAGTWLGGGLVADSARTPTETLSVREHAGIVDYVAGDFTITARAGTTLAEIAAVTARENQWLTLDPMGSDAGTLGATIATASAGPLATGFGGPRDIVLGLEAVTGRGAVIRGGGRVVKNVAGFDLTRLLTGAWGTLGIVTEVSVRLRARPECDETIAITIGASPADVAHVCASLQTWPFAPMAMELLSASLAQRVTGAATTVALIRISGNERDVRAQAAAVDMLGLRVPFDADVWTRYRSAEPTGACVFRLSAPRTRLPNLWEMATRIAAANDGAMYSATPARGVVRCILPQPDRANLSLGSANEATLIVEQAAGVAFPARPVDATIGQLERRLRDAFNPTGTLNPGVMVRTS
jgi:glycolate oxidase FAD binding subunit